MVKEMGTLDEGARNAVEVCMGVKPGEHVLIVTDKPQYEVGDAIRRAALGITQHVRLFVLEDYGERPMTALPEEIEKAVPWANVTFWAAESKKGELPMRRSFRLLATKYARHAHMPGVTRLLMEQGMCSDYRRISAFTKRLEKILKDVKELRITNPAGTDLVIELNPEWRWKPSDGIYHEKGQWGNLPEGEIFTAPFRAEGHLVADELGDWFSKKYGILTKPEAERDAPVHIDIVDSRADIKSIECELDELKADLKDYLQTDENSNRAGEIALPTNLELIEMPLVGILLQDEKARVHLAFGNPYPKETGANWVSKTHIDCIIKRATVLIDGKKIIEEDKYLIDIE
ncbi:MAG: hypothetical protein DRN92_02675 [Thermoproteota archaeon]|nr:MAG: hypothetical protein DRN92_02675 [Candidatus Korarchaeota archaeon]